MDNSKLLKAINEKDIVRVKLLLESGECLPNRDGSSRNPPLLECLTADNDADVDGDEEDFVKCEILKILVQYGANVNIQIEAEEFCDLVMPDKTAAMFAAENGYPKCLQFLHESGAYLNALCPFGETALLFAVQQRRVQCVQYLAGCMSPEALNSKDEDGMTALMWATSLPPQEGLPCMNHLIAAGADLNLENVLGRTALMIALRYSFVEAVHLLLDKGAVFRTVTWDGFTPLATAFCRRVANSSCILRLLETGEDPTASRRNLNNVHRSVCWGQLPLVKALVKSGHPPLDLKCDEFLADDLSSSLDNQAKFSPLAMALFCKNPDIARYFIVNRFFTYYDIAKLNQNDFILNSLQKPKSFFRYDFSRLKEAERKECLKIFHFLSSNPPSLLNLCLVAISSALCCSLLVTCIDSGAKKYPGAKNRWMCTPTFREKVSSLDLPSVIKRTLLFQTPSSGICCQSWKDISLEGEFNFQQCHCDFCKGISSVT